jgi:hypothetical protein
MRKAFDWNRSRISMLEVEAVLQSCILKVQIALNIVLHMINFLLVKRFDCESDSWLFPFYEKYVCARQISCQGVVRDNYLLGELHIIYIDRGRFYFRVVNATWVDFDLLAFILHF